MVETRRIIYGWLPYSWSSFNVLFTEPRYTFIIDDPNYIITLIIFILAVFLLGTLTTSLQNEITQSKENERKISFLYDLNQTLMAMPNVKDHIDQLKRAFDDLINRKTFIYILNHKKPINSLLTPYSEYAKEIGYALEHQVTCGYKETKFADLPIKLIPHMSKKNISGVLIVNCENKNLSEKEIETIKTAMSHILTIVERELLLEINKNNRIEIEKERLKTTLLRSISHDLRTPLTTIQSGTSFMFDSYETIDDETKKDMLQDINNETQRLSQFVENLLNMTRLNTNNLKLNLKRELIDDVLSDIHSKVSKYLKNHDFIVHSGHPDDTILIDTPLFVQVITNLVDNAIRHTPEKTRIEISYTKDKDETWFLVKDNGRGIDEQFMPVLFKAYARAEYAKSDASRGFGLGLSICKAIVNAHHGKIEAFNNEDGGATFRFSIPNRR